MPRNQRAILTVILVTCALCPACRWGMPLLLPRSHLPADGEDVTAPPPGQSSDRRDPPAFMPEA